MCPLPREARKLSEDTTISILKNAPNNHIWDCKLNVHAAIYLETLETTKSRPISLQRLILLRSRVIIIMIKLYAVGRDPILASRKICWRQL